MISEFCTAITVFTQQHIICKIEGSGYPLYFPWNNSLRNESHFHLQECPHEAKMLNARPNSDGNILILPIPFPLKSKFLIPSLFWFLSFQKETTIAITTHHCSRSNFSKKDLDARICGREIYWGERHLLKLLCRFLKGCAAIQFILPNSRYIKRKQINLLSI